MCCLAVDMHNMISNLMLCRFVNVVKKPDVNKFRAYIVLQHKQVHLGYFPAKEQAARAVDVAKLYMVQSRNRDTCCLHQQLMVTPEHS